MIGTTEIIIILAIILLIFGPSKLPQLGSGIGMMLRGFKSEIRAMDGENSAPTVAAVEETSPPPAGDAPQRVS